MHLKGLVQDWDGYEGDNSRLFVLSNPDFALPLSYGGSKNTSPISKSDGDVNAITSKDLSFHTPTNVSPGKIAAAKGRKSNSRKKGHRKNN